MVKSPVINPYTTKLPLATALNTFDLTVGSRNSDLLLTPTYVLILFLN